MSIPIEEAVIKFKDFIVAIDEIKKILETEGFKIVASDDFELGAEWLVTYDNQPVAEMMWNIPYMLSFKPRIKQGQEEFFVDYIKNIRDWRNFLDDIVESIIETKGQKNSSPNKQL